MLQGEARMSNIETSTAEALARANQVYWKSLLALFCAAFTIIAFILIYLLTDWLISECQPVGWLQHLVGVTADCDRTPSIFLVTVTAGALGAIFSNISRLYQVGEVSALFAQKIIEARLRDMTLYAAVPAVIGAVAAAIIYLIFAGKFIQGTPFPAFTCSPDHACDSVDALVNHWGPDKAEDYAKIIFWGFLGGFSERLIPDMLGQYSKLLEQKAAEAGKNQKALDTAKTAADDAQAKADEARTKANDMRVKADQPAASKAQKDAAAKAEAEATVLGQKAKAALDAYDKLRSG